MIHVSEQRLQTACLLFVVAVLGALSAYWLRPVLVPFVVAVFAVSGVAPILESLQKSIASSRLTAAVIAFLAGFLVLALLMAALWASVTDLARHAPAYQARVEKLIVEVRAYLPEEQGPLTPKPQGVDDVSTIPSPPVPRPERIEEFTRRMIRGAVVELSRVFLDLFSTSVIVMIYVFFLLLGAPAHQSSSQLVRDLDGQIRSYLSLKTVISLATGAAFGFALWFFGVPMAVPFGMLAFLLNFIPNIGPVIASLLPLPLIVLQPDAGLLWMAAVIAVTFGIQFVSGNVIEPRMMGDQSDLHPIVVLLSLMFWGVLWGMVGMFLATPITAAIRIGLAQFEATRAVAELMAGRWPQEMSSPSTEKSPTA